MATRTDRESAASSGGKLYYSISEVAELLNVKAHVLRYWETQFKMLRPRKNRAGNRSYRVKDVKMALRIKKLLYDEGFTIAGARRKLLDERRSAGGQTELDFVGISRDELLHMVENDLSELLRVVRGEQPIESLGQQPHAAGGLFHDLDLTNGEAPAATTEEDDVVESDAVEPAPPPPRRVGEEKPGGDSVESLATQKSERKP